MTEDDDELEDWEIEDEEAPERLERKWSGEPPSYQETVACPSCQKELSSDCLTCLFCGAQVFHDSGLLGKLLKWFKKIF